jgi:hypothetical protein
VNDKAHEQRRVRLKVLAAAYAYEIMNESFMSDAEFDALALRVDLNVPVDTHDQWWKDNFDPSTGAWVHRHPDQKGLRRLVQSVFDK